ncbi:VanZ family protein [Clostridium algidicarnis]|uniref:VanZ family protein n=1 Tax=Clostridium algidicarnis TaxID=37659 RepID=A0ABS6C515_9CLOT|nr:VanZ family protein [Clostridium algidicarnis]MBB6632105.1 VanZ family protein [Clostridium algidicarnis]MBB6698380.1 VanZ family protein [Clostridium algidicarnis]MBU3193762.1 VanZ family protein [Clostridium algidicarnis]MBU3204796.1 VanZ family protein [Clostridium algidicarnis]MBU3207229.1 VanZ family protein [Clostridium algidicarnis]
MKKVSKKQLNFALLIGWMVLIFYFSSQIGEVSSEKSKIVIYIFNVLGLDLNTYFGELSTLIVRKSAHFTEYFILFILTYNVMKYYFEKGRLFFISYIITVAYAMTDEFHQLFVPGRAGALKDVLIDSTGGLFALLIVFVFVKIKKDEPS